MQQQQKQKTKNYQKYECGFLTFLQKSIQLLQQKKNSTKHKVGLKYSIVKLFKPHLLLLESI